MLKTERHEKILFVTLNRPEKRNALHPEMIRDLLTTLDVVATDPTFNVVVITGAGSSFCAGLDLAHVLGAADVSRTQKMGQIFDVFLKIYRLPQPVIAAINGPAIAGGFDLAQFCDLRLCAPHATFGQAEINLGLTQLMFPLYQTIGVARAKELALTGAPISAEEAWRIGFVNHIYAADQLLPEALKLAQTLAAKPREALFATKRLGREMIDLNTEATLALMQAAIQERLQSEEHKQTLANYLNQFNAQD